MHAKLSIKSKIVLIATSVMLFSMGAIIATSSYSFTQEYTHALESRSLAIGKGVKVQLERLLRLTYGIRVDDLIGFDQQCQDIVKTNEGIRYAMVVGPAGDVVFHNDRTRVGRRVSDPALLVAIARRAETVVRHGENGTTMYSAVVPSFSGDDQYAASVVVGFDAELVAGKARKMLEMDVAIGLSFVLAGGAVLLIALSAFVTRRLARLVTAIERLRVNTPGETTRADVDSQDEIGTLASTFNAMTEKLSQTVQGLNEQIAERGRAEGDLKRHRDHLEELVKERTAQLMVEKERAEVASLAKSAFLASMSHELRTPLHGILGYAQILQRSRGLDARQEAGVNTIHSCGEHLLTLIDDILELSRIEAGKLELYPRAVNLQSFLRVISDTVRVKADEKNLLFSFAASADLPRAVIIDDKRLRQILLNLLGNAVKFTDRGTVSLRVQQRTLTDGVAQLCFEVQDTGSGIAEEHLESIFQPFEQVGDVGPRIGGTGLGLAISRQLVRLMGHDIFVRSIVGQGSCFWFDLALVVAEAEAEPEAPRSEQVVVGYAGERKKVLIVDDIAANRGLAADFLRSLGFEIYEAENGQIGLDKVEAVRPDLILMDNVMPVMNGLEAIRRLRQRPDLAGLPIIAISASASAADRCRSLAAGSSAFLPKPLDLDELQRQIQTLLQVSWLRGRR